MDVLILPLVTVLFHFIIYELRNTVIYQTFLLSAKYAAHLTSVNGVSIAHVTTGGSTINMHLFSVFPHVSTCLGHM